MPGWGRANDVADVETAPEGDVRPRLGPRTWAWLGLLMAAAVAVTVLIANPAEALYVPPMMIAVGMGTILGGTVVGALVALAGVVAVLVLHGLDATGAYLGVVLLVAAGLADRVAGGLSKGNTRADDSLALLSVLIAALHRVAETPGVRDADATLPGLLRESAGEGILVWRTTHGEPEAVAGASHLEDADAVAEVVRQVAADGVEIDEVRGRRGRRRHLTAVPIFDRGDVVAVFTAYRPVPLAARERRIVQEFTATLGHVLTKLHEERAGDLVLQFVQHHDSAVGTAPMSQALLELLLPELGVWGGTVMRYQGGRFVSEALAGDLQEGLTRRLEAGMPYGEGVVWEGYRLGEALFIDDYRQHPGASSELAAYGVRAAAVVPTDPAPGSSTVVVLFHNAPRHWLASERAMVIDLVSVLRASVTQRRSEARVTEVARLQRDLLATPVDEMYQRLVEAAVRLVPDTERASLLVKGDDDAFHFAAAVGYDLEALSPLTFTNEAMRAWYGEADEGWFQGAPRVLRTTESVSVAERSSLSQPAVAATRAADVDAIVANLCLPVVYRDATVAVLNLDALQDPDAFRPSAMAVAAGLAPFVGFLLHESDVRRQLAAAAHTDVLTGLANRRAFNEEVDRDIRRATRYGEPLALLVLDLTGFKRINDRFGHDAGDAALRDVAKALRSASRGGDRLYRWGGDEFAVLLAHADAEAAHAAALRMAGEIGEIATPAGAMSVNIGVALVPADGTDLDELVRVADTRMFRAKASGQALVESESEA